MLQNNGSAWSDEDVAKLASLSFSYPRPAIEVIAAKLGRSTSAIQTEMSKIGLTKRGAKLRPCLGVICAGKKQFFRPELASVSVVIVAATHKCATHPDERHRSPVPTSVSAEGGSYP